jgi:hypothetical protein
MQAPGCVVSLCDTHCLNAVLNPCRRSDRQSDVSAVLCHMGGKATIRSSHHSTRRYYSKNTVYVRVSSYRPNQLSQQKWFRQSRPKQLLEITSCQFIVHHVQASSRIEAVSIVIHNIHQEHLSSPARFALLLAQSPRARARMA